MDAAEAYRDARIRVTELVTTLDEHELDITVPACPDWRVIDLFAHLAGVAADALADNFKGGNDWTAAQVEARKGRSRDEIAAEWADVGARIEEQMAAMSPMIASVLVADVASHEHDMRGAVAMAGAQDSNAVDIGLQFAVSGLDRRLKKDGRPALRIVAGTQEFLVGEGDPAATLTSEPFDLFRAIIGRRTDAEIAAFEWEGDSAPYLPVFAAFPKPAEPLPF